LITEIRHLVFSSVNTFELKPLFLSLLFYLELLVRKNIQIGALNWMKMKVSFRKYWSVLIDKDTLIKNVRVSIVSSPSRDFLDPKQGWDSQNFLGKFVRFFVTLALKNLRLFRLKVLFEADY